VKNVPTFKLRIHQNPFGRPRPLAGLRGCGTRKREMGEKERRRGDRKWEEKGTGEDMEMGGGREEGGRGGSRKEHLPHLRFSSGYASECI